MPPTPSQRRESGAPALVVSGEERCSAQAYCAHARHAALVAVSLCRLDWRSLGERSLSFDARPWCDVPAASCDLQRQASLASHVAQARLRSLSLWRRRSTQACCSARAVPRWLWWARALSKGAVPARAPFPSARVRGATCVLEFLIIFVAILPNVIAFHSGRAVHTVVVLFH